MTIKTFDPNRVGGGTFQLEQANRQNKTNYDN